MIIPRRLKTFLIIIGITGAVCWAGVRLMRSLESPAVVTLPTAPAKLTSVAFSITAKGTLQGGNSKMLTAPTTGSAQLVLTHLRKPGELVKQDEVIAQFDTTEENFKLREAEADLAEAAQQVTQSQNESEAKQEELRAEMTKARADVRVAELDCRRNPLLAAIAVRQNELELSAARERLAKLERDYPQRLAAATASIAIQQAGQNKARVQAGTARTNMEKMTLKAPVGGYVNIERNTNSNWMFPGMQFPLFQVGDAVRPGMAVAQIPDLASWEVTARIAEQDRGYINTGQPATFQIVSLPGRSFPGKVTNLGGTTGPPWDRRFECKLALTTPSPDLRPGMSVVINVETGRLDKVITVPAQALFERDGKPFVYLATGRGYMPHDVKLVRRSENQVVVEGLSANQEVALANPDQADAAGKNSGGAKGATKAVTR